MVRIPVGIYIHIPFCVKKCSYCDFLSAPATESTRESYVAALLCEIKCMGIQYGNQVTVDTVYIGGGTPSLLGTEQCKRIVDCLREYFPSGTYQEFTIEANPGTVDLTKLAMYRKLSINRLSLGLQSPRQDELDWLGRIHTYEEFVESYHAARECGFQNINVDLMSGLKGQTVASFEQNLRTVLGLCPEHLSVYSLIVEEGTGLYEQYHEEPVIHIEEDRAIYHNTVSLLSDYGYEQYEISNYARPGYASQHNSSYWEGKPYFGFGLGASSYWNHVRYCNVGKLSEYLVVSRNPELLHKDHIEVDKVQQMEEFMFLGLRKTKGVSETVFAQLFGETMESVYGAILDKWIVEGGLERKDGRVALTSFGVDISNVILADFLLT